MKAQLLLLLAVASLWLSLPDRVFCGHQGQKPAGKVVGIRGTVYIKRDKNSNQVKLNPKSDRERLLYAGEWLRCKKGAILRLKLYDKPLVLNKDHGWFIIPHIATTSEPPPQEWHPAGREKDKLAARRSEQESRPAPSAAAPDSRPTATAEAPRSHQAARAEASPEAKERDKAEFAVGATAGGARQYSAFEIRPILTEYLRIYLNAYARKDTAALEALLSSDYTSTDPFGSVTTKAEEIKAIESGTSRLEAFGIDRFSLRTYTDTAVITARLPLKGRIRGQEIDGQFQLTQIWVKQQGSWQLITSHNSRVQQESK